MKRARQFFTEKECEQITNAVCEAERQTSGEIVPVVATASGEYHRAEDVGGLLLGLAALIAVWMRFQRVVPIHGDWERGHKLTVNLIWVLVCVVAGFIAGVGITSRLGWLKRLLATHREMRGEVERAAWAAFDKFRVGRTAHGTGILLYASLFEQMVCVLGDEGIGAKLDQEIWDKIHREIAEGIRTGNAATAFCRAIAQSGELLHQHFPKHAGDAHKLSNQLRIVD